MPNAHEKVPSAWRIIRAHLAVRESSTFKDIYAAVKEHRPNYQQKRFENKLTHMRSLGLIANLTKTDEDGRQKAQRGVYKLTQDGRRDISDPEEAHGLLKGDGSTSRSKAQKERAEREQRDTAKLGANLVKARAKVAEMRANGTLVYKKKPGRPRKQQPEQAKPVRIIQSKQSADKPQVTIAGTPTPVDAELIERLLKAASPRPAANTEQEITVPISTDIRLRLKLIVELA